MTSTLNIAFAQINTVVGDIAGNTQKAIDEITKARSLGVELLLFSELFIPGYLAKDLFFQEGFAEKCEEATHLVAKECIDISVVIGNISINKNENGKHLYNSAYVLQNGKIEGIYNKHLLPSYDVFDENRYFEKGTSPLTFNVKGLNFGVTVCEDIWHSTAPSIYTSTPIDAYAKLEIDALVNIAASPFSAKQHLEREYALETVFNTLQIPVYYSNAYGAHTNIIFDGRSAVCSSKGVVKAPFKEGLFTTNDLLPETENIQEWIENALVLGIRDYFNKLGFKKAILGLSGGVDSALVAALACKALGAENVYCVLLPSQYSSDHSISDSEKLVKNLGCLSRIIPIENANNQLLLDLESEFEGTENGIAEENIQSRVRAIILMAISNKKGHLLLNTSNKSESAVGYGTLYGDMCGALSPIADLFKIEVYELCEYINRNGEIIPNNILTKPPSAELRPDQKDSDSLPDYDKLDALLYDYIEEKMSVQSLKNKHGKFIDVDRIVRLVNIAEYKRYQLPPVLRVSKKSFGEGRQLPIVGKYQN